MDYTVKSESPKVIRIGIMLFLLRWLPQKSYNKFLHSQIKSIDSNALRYYVRDLIETMKLTKKVSSKYSNTNFETSIILNDMPILKPYSTYILSFVRSHRAKCKLII